MPADGPKKQFHDKSAAREGMALTAKGTGLTSA